MIDASFGFEMEVFEFLNICQVHGFPRIMGVLTHLDYFKNNKSLRKIKKTMKKRFWTEVYKVRNYYSESINSFLSIGAILQLSNSLFKRILTTSQMGPYLMHI